MSGRQIATLIGKIELSATLRLVTGLHIGASKDSTSIGDVENTVARDPLSRRPLIPGSSLKGKLRTLLAKAHHREGFLDKANTDPEPVLRLFGSSQPVKHARLQFYDLFMTDESAEKISRMDTDLYLTEVKFENAIDRLTAVANPRSVERVPAGAEFAFRLVYNIENEEEITQDLTALAKGLKLLELDYLGGHGSRGYGRLKFEGLKIRVIPVDGKQAPSAASISETLRGAGFDVVPAV